MPEGYRLDPKAPGDECAIEIDLEALSLLGDALSLQLTYRRLPGECATPLRDGGYHAVRSIRLGSAAAARVDDYAQPERLLQELRKAHDVADRVGAEATSAASLQALFERLGEATAGQCERRMTPASLSQFYVAAASADAVDLRIAWSDECGQLGDEPQLQSVSLPLRKNDLKKGVDARTLDLPAVHLRFVSPD